jgi:hypothetical protein
MVGIYNRKIITLLSIYSYKSVGRVTTEKQAMDIRYEVQDSKHGEYLQN